MWEIAIRNDKQIKSCIKDIKKLDKRTTLFVEYLSEVEEKLNDYKHFHLTKILASSILRSNIICNDTIKLRSKLFDLKGDSTALMEVRYKFTLLPLSYKKKFLNSLKKLN